jgi:predicted subunit of tRNA(5-methylaminomethyl-2-thiouridylate) methyltransferase
MRAAIRLVALLLAATVAAPAVAAIGDDFMAGYVTAVIERDFGLEVVSVEVRDGVAYVVVKSLGEQPAERIAAAISHVEGIERVEVAELDWEGEPRARAEE